MPLALLWLRSQESNVWGLIPYNNERIFMRVPKVLKGFCVGLMSIMMTQAPQVALAEGVMISTSSVVTELTRSQSEAQVQDMLNRDEVRKALAERGISSDEISSKIAALSDTELQQLGFWI